MKASITRLTSVVGFSVVFCFGCGGVRPTNYDDDNSVSMVLSSGSMLSNDMRSAWRRIDESAPSPGKQRKAKCYDMTPKTPPKTHRRNQVYSGCWSHGRDYRSRTFRACKI